MILRYSAENFYSLNEKVVVDFTISPTTRERAGMLKGDGEDFVNSVLGVFGANASGKTNLIRPLGFLSWFILDSARAKPGSEITYEPFAFPPDKDRPTKLELEFEFKGGHYRYELDLLGNTVAREALFRKKTRFSYLFERTWNPESGEHDFKAQDLGPVASIPQRANASWISSALLAEHGLAVELRPFFEGFQGNLVHYGHQVQSYGAELPNVFEAAMYLRETPEIMSSVSKLLSEFDLGLSRVELRETNAMGADGKEQIYAFPFGIHEIAGQSFAAVFIKESRGTQSLFVLLRYLMPVLEQGGIAFLDEFESGLHPHMVRRIVELFFNPATNPKKAQLIATFHTDFLLRDTFHKYQIYFAEKNEQLETEAYRLDSIKGVRNVDNIYDKYHAGTYGAIPCLP